MIDTLNLSLQTTSRRLSALGKTELAQHQESVIQALGFAKIDGVPCEVFESDEIDPDGLSSAMTSQQISNNFLSNDVKISILSGGERAVVLFSVASEEFFDGVPVFWQNYLVADFLPAMFVACIERVEIAKDQFEYLVLPYFSILKLSGEKPEPMIGFVGEELRGKAMKEPEVSQREAMSNIGIFLGLAIKLLKSGEVAGRKESNA